MNLRIRLEDFKIHTSLSDLKCSKSGQSAAFLTTVCDEASNGYRHTLWLYESGRVSRAGVPENPSFYQWEDENTILIGWRRADSTRLARLQAAENRLSEEWELPFRAKTVLPLLDGRFAVTTIRDENAHEEGNHRAFEIFEELPLRQNAGGYTSGRRCELSIYDPATGRRIQVSAAPFDVEQVALTPNGESLVYSGRAYQSMRLLDHAIWRYVLSSGEKQEVLSQKEKMFLGYFACDNESVVYSATDCKPYGFGQVKYLYRFSFASGETSLFHACLRNTGTTEVIADGRRGELSQFCLRDKALYIGSTWGYANHIFRVTAEEGFQEILHVDGSVDALDIAGDGAILMIAHLGQRLQELYRVESGEAVRVTAFNEAFYERAKPVKPAHFVYQNDGVDLDGWVLLPDGFDREKSYPAILSIHGGPRLVYGEIYFHEMQAWCARGYVVMYCNPRGGSGKGNDFSNLWSPRTLGDWDYRDTMAFVDEVLLCYPNIDKNRVGVTGGSYGGFLTNWILGHTGRFAAAVSQRSISNWFVTTLTSDNGYYDWDRIADSDPWEDIAEMWRVSPIRYAKDATTPTLFIHSFDDYRCPIEEGLQMFTCLRMHGVPARMCAFYDENHELSRNGKPDNRLKRLQEITNWFDRYLMPAT